MVIRKARHSYKINARDIFRLIYHNQELDPSGVYKSSDASSAYDSQNIRATIFQLLIGRAFSEYYTTETELKEQVKEKDTLKLIIKEFNRTFEMLNDGREVMNSKFIEKKIEEESHKLSALEKQRDNLKKNRISSSDGAFIDVNKLKEEISRVSEQIENKDKERRKKVTERRRFEAHRETHRMELKNIEKIIVSHETLSIFDINTCPSCLRPTPRKENHCICGQPIDEYEYERFFYTTAEYTDILQSKQSAGKTIDIAIEATKKEISVLSNQISSLDKIYKLRKKEVKERLSKIEAGIDTKSLDKLEDEMLKAKEEVKTLRRLLIEEKRREGYQEKYERAEKAVNTLQSNLNKLRESTHKEMEVKIEKFDKIYNELMRATLSECRSARIDPYDYMPIINNGEYREASSYVPRRLMYYITLLSMSLQDKTIKFPQLLLVDTPQTAGVGKDDLAHALSIIPQEVEGKEEYQIILTTAGDVLPTTLEKFVFQTLKGNKDKLLIKRK